MSVPAPRYDVRISIKLVMSDPRGTFSGVTINVSETGMLVSSTAARPRGAIVQFEFVLFSGEAEVIWIREEEPTEVLLGLKFVSLSRRDRHALREHVLRPAAELQAD